MGRTFPFFTAAAIMLFSCGFESLDNQCKSNFSYDTIQRLVNQAPIIMGPKWTPTPAPEVTYTVDPDLPSGFTLNASTGEISGTPSYPIFSTHTITATIEEGASKQSTVSILVQTQVADKAALVAAMKTEIEKEGPNVNLAFIDTSQIVNMDNLFNPVNNPFTEDFNGDLSIWDVSQVTSMDGMFRGAAEFNQDIGSWDVGNVTNMHQMFYQASKFNQDLGSWEVGNVDNMTGMFIGAVEFNQDLGPWPVGKVQKMQYMFYGASKFNQNLDAWGVAGSVTKDYMFQQSAMENNPPSWYP